MATLDPSRASDHRADGPATIAYPDPFPSLPPEPYPSAHPASAEDTDPPTDPEMPALSDTGDAFDPPTDPEMPALSESSDAFDPFAADAYRPLTPWYRRPSALAALGAIMLAVAAVLIAAFLLLSGKWTVGTGSDTDTSPAPTPDATTSSPATTPLTSPPPPPPPPPPPLPAEAPQNRAPANPGNTYAPVYPRQTQDGRRNVTTPETRPPDISVRPTHRPAFPGQAGEQ